MPRAASETRTEELEAALTEYVLANGISDLSLRPVAAALGTSTYTLVYHFGSKEAVVAAALRGINSRLVQLHEEWAESTSPGQILRRYWDYCSKDSNRPYMTVWYETYVLSLRSRERFPGFLETDGLHTWAALVAGLIRKQVKLSPRDAERVATMLVSIAAGMQLDLLAGNDLKRTSASVDMAAGALDALVESLLQKKTKKR